MKTLLGLLTLLIFSSAVMAGSDLPVFETRMGNTFKTAWTKGIYKDITDNDLDELLTVSLKSSELKTLKCSNYNSFKETDKKKFWAILMASIAAAESAFDPKSFYSEPGTNDSYGLVQIDGPNSRAHGCVKRDGSRPTGGAEGREQGKEMYTPAINLRCGMYIVRNQLRRSGTLFYAKSYWAVLRVKRPGHGRFKRFFHKHIGLLQKCK